MVITTAEAIGCDDMVVNFLFIVLWQVVPLGGGERGGGHLFEDINPVHTAEAAYTQNYDCCRGKTTIRNNIDIKGLLLQTVPLREI